MRLRMLTWSVSTAGSPSRSPAQLTAALEASDCDVAALMRVPPRWLPAVARRAPAEYRELPAPRRSLWHLLTGRHGPRVGTVAIVARRDRLIDARPAQLPRHLVLGARLAVGPWVVVLDAAGAGDDAPAEVRAAAQAALGWSGSSPVLLAVSLPGEAPELDGFRHAAACGASHLYLAGPVEPVDGRRAGPPAAAGAGGDADPAAGALILDVRLGQA